MDRIGKLELRIGQRLAIYLFLLARLVNGELRRSAIPDAVQEFSASRFTIVRVYSPGKDALRA